MSWKRTEESELSFARDLPLTQQAIRFAAEQHATQRRDGDGAEFMVHPVEVAAIVRGLGYDDDVVAAAVLHDVLEDTDAERRDLETRFGRRVADLVAVVSDDPSIDDEDERRADLREQVSHGGPDALAVFAADKISKVRELRMLMAGGMTEDAAESKHHHYRESLAMLERQGTHERLLDELRFELETLESLPPQARSASAP
ncbi:MAG: HD domain-containing protein [Solirubrobacteraceae bacterium]